MSDEHAEKFDPEPYRSVKSASMPEVDDGKKPDVRIVIDNAKLPKEIGDSNVEALRRYSHELASALENEGFIRGMSAKLQVHYFTGINGPDYEAVSKDSVEKGTSIIKMKVIPADPNRDSLSTVVIEGLTKKTADFLSNNAVARAKAEKEQPTAHSV